MSGLFTQHSSQLLHRLIDQTRQLLLRENELIDHDEVHAVKSLLYAVLERLGTHTERIQETQKMLRELFSIIALSKDIREEERQNGLQILDSLHQTLQSFSKR